jgi:ABC-2 type transport system ATP-binding protein
MNESGNVVTARGLSKHFGDFSALDGVNFDIRPGSIVGLIGPNGAGKTTTLKSLLGLTGFDGDLDVLGVDPRKDRKSLMQRVCFISDVGVLPRWLRAREAVAYIDAIHPRFNREKAMALLEKTNIPMNNRVKQLSKGMVTQLHLALVMAIEVDLLVLDEPTLGLDILYRKEFYDRLLNDYFDHQTSIIISTHQVEEIESILTHLLFINKGKIVLDAAMDDLSEQYVEVLVKPEHVEQALAFGPIYTRDMLGKKNMIFERGDRTQLEGFGEINVPSVADLFVAKMQRS